MCVVFLSVGGGCLIQVDVYFVFLRMSNRYRCHGYKQRHTDNNCTRASFPVSIYFASLQHSFQFQVELWPALIQRVKSFSSTNQCICCILQGGCLCLIHIHEAQQLADTAVSLSNLLLFHIHFSWSQSPFVLCVIALGPQWKYTVFYI